VVGREGQGAPAPLDVRPVGLGERLGQGHRARRRVEAGALDVADPVGGGDHVGGEPPERLDQLPHGGGIGADAGVGVEGRQLVEPDHRQRLDDVVDRRPVGRSSGHQTFLR
jgi:hypothetical protein